MCWSEYLCEHVSTFICKENGIGFKTDSETLLDNVLYSSEPQCYERLGMFFGTLKSSEFIVDRVYDENKEFKKALLDLYGMVSEKTSGVLFAEVNSEWLDVFGEKLLEFGEVLGRL